ncbi:glycosyltransferase family 2 protein [Vibrio tetraodonis]|uniref:glycosyltransferase family 2 protein n=1 Tax=Vibrio tetraodonis TaxID=2231647 RepID=UPI000E0B971A|nr:glycosyltransferase [Vibrio tetraodonis]
MKLQILISTMDDRIFNIEFNKVYEYVIIHQLRDLSRLEEYDNFIDNISKEVSISYHKMTDLGLSKSRNKALEFSDADIVWIMDDDTKILDNAYSEIVSFFIDSDNDFISVLHYMGEKLIAKQKNNTKINAINSAKISSINMVLSKSCVDSGVRFDENFGLGTSLPSGEEYIFITDLIHRNFKGCFTDIHGCIHTEELSSGKDFYSSKKLVLAKLYMFKRIFPKTYWFWILLFFIKKLNKFSKHKPIFKSALREFISK